MKLPRGPKFDRKLHGTLTLVWFALIAPSLLWWKSSIPWIVFMSVWANLAGHYSSWQAAKAEDRIDEMTDDEGKIAT